MNWVVHIRLWIFYFFSFWVPLFLLYYQDVFPFPSPCFHERQKLWGHGCSYGESVLILQRRNKAFSFIFPGLIMMKPKLRSGFLMYWCTSELKRGHGHDKLIDFLQAFEKGRSWGRIGKIWLSWLLSGWWHQYWRLCVNISFRIQQACEMWDQNSSSDLGFFELSRKQIWQKMTAVWSWLA